MRSNIWYIDTILYRSGHIRGLPTWASRVLEAPRVPQDLPGGQLLASPDITPDEAWDPDWPVDKCNLPGVKLKGVSPQEAAHALRAVPSDTAEVTYSVGKRRRKELLLDMWWSLTVFQPQSGSDDALDRSITDATLCLTMNSELPHTPATWRSLYIDPMLAIHKATRDCLYGFVSCENAADTNLGILYTLDNLEPYHADLEREERAWWHQSTDRRHKVRGAYWGNFFGPECVSVMRKAGVLEQFEALGKDGWDAPVRLQGPFKSGAMFLTLSDNPLDAKGYRGSDTPFARRRLRMLSILKKHKLLPTVKL